MPGRVQMHRVVKYGGLNIALRCLEAYMLRLKQVIEHRHSDRLDLKYLDESLISSSI